MCVDTCEEEMSDTSWQRDNHGEKKLLCAHVVTTDGTHLFGKQTQSELRAGDAVDHIRVKNKCMRSHG
jgi:hypothetical protein